MLLDQPRSGRCAFETWSYFCYVYCV